MKIMYVIHSLTIGGAEKIVVDYLLQLKKMGHEAVLLQMTDRKTFLNRRLDQDGVRTVTACRHPGKGPFSKLDTVWNFRKLIREEKPDIIHVHTGMEKFRFVRYPADRMVFTLHSDWRRSLAQGKNHRETLFRMIEKGMSVVVLNRKAQQDVLGRFPNAKVYGIPNGMDFDQIRDRRYSREGFLEQLGIPESGFILGHVGRFHPVKNHEKIIDVFCRVLEKRKDAFLLLVGGGDPDEERRVRRLAAESRAAQQIRFLGQREDAAQITGILDCRILPSYSESFPLTLLEAEILGVRSVVSTGVPEEVCVNNNCLRLPLEESSEKWAEYVLGDCLSEKKYALEDFALGNVMDRHVQLYQCMLSE